VKDAEQDSSKDVSQDSTKDAEQEIEIVSV
jgi:hypothetical protein